jgi:hypothetical protein
MPQLPYWERWPFPFLRQPPLRSFDVLGVSKQAFPGRGKILGLSLEIGLLRQPSVFAAIVNSRALLPYEVPLRRFLRLRKIWR